MMADYDIKALADEFRRLERSGIGTEAARVHWSWFLAGARVLADQLKLEEKP